MARTDPAEQLNKDGIRSAAIHGNKSLCARTRALADFKSGDIRVLVVTDMPRVVSTLKSYRTW